MDLKLCSWMQFWTYRILFNKGGENSAPFLSSLSWGGFKEMECYYLQLVLFFWSNKYTLVLHPELGGSLWHLAASEGTRIQQLRDWQLLEKGLGSVSLSDIISPAPDQSGADNRALLSRYLPVSGKTRWCDIANIEWSPAGLLLPFLKTQSLNTPGLLLALTRGWTWAVVSLGRLSLKSSMTFLGAFSSVSLKHRSWKSSCRP